MKGGPENPSKFFLLLGAPMSAYIVPLSCALFFFRFTIMYDLVILKFWHCISSLWKVHEINILLLYGLAKAVLCHSVY